MKRFRLLIFFSFIICCFFALAGCAPTLSVPTDVAIDGDELLLTWEKVENAQYYTIDISGEEFNATTNSYSLVHLSKGNYTIKVKAEAEDFKDSEWSETIPFEREEESGMVFKLINNKTEYELSNIGVATGDIRVPDFYRGKPVTSIGKKAFFQKSKLTGITLGENIKTIGEQAFFKCSYLKTANIPSSVVSIGAKAFQNCVILESDIVIPSGVQVIEEGVFGYCRALKKVTISDGVQTISATAFTDCENLEKIVIPDSVETIGQYAFSACGKASELTMGTGLKQIGKNAFYQCESLKSIEVGENVELIDEYAFASCAEMTSVVMSDKTVAIGVGAFMDCEKLNQIELSKNLVTIGQDAFKNTVKWNEASNLVYVGWTEEDGSYVNAWLVDCKNKTKRSYSVAEGTIGIGSCAFLDCIALTDVILPNSVKIIDNAAYAYCTALANLVIGEGVETIASQAFWSCVSLKNVRLGGFDFTTQKMTTSSLKEIQSYAFYSCTFLEKIEIPDTVTDIGTYAFNDTALFKNSTDGAVYAGNWLVGYNKEAFFNYLGESGESTIVVKDGTVGIAEYAFYRAMVPEIILPDSVEKIGRAAFYESPGLQKITLPSNLTRIEEFTFYGCYSLTDIVFPESLEYIGRSAFYECQLLGCEIKPDGLTVVDKESKLIIPDSVKEIGPYAFYKCGFILEDEETGEKTVFGVDEIVIGDGVEKIGLNAFNKFVSVKKIMFGKNVQEVADKAFYACTELEVLVLNEGLQSIGLRAFYGCEKLKGVTIPGSLETVSKYAFYKCVALESVTIKEGVKVIEDYAFSGAAALKNLELPSTLTSIGKQAFRNAKALKSVTLSENIVTMANHAFYGCTSATFYVECEVAPEGWAARWNSSHQPVIWGVTLGEEGQVVSFTKTAEKISNCNESVTINAPEWTGHVFIGWTTVQGDKTVQVKANEIATVQDGTVLYAIWE